MALALDILQDYLVAQGAVVHVAEASTARNLAAALLLAASSGNAGLVRRILSDARSIPGFIQRNAAPALEAAQRKGDRTIAEILNSAIHRKHTNGAQNNSSGDDDAGRDESSYAPDTSRTPYRTGIGIDSTRGLWIHL